MKTILFSALALMMFCSSCDSNKTETKTTGTAEVPASMEENSSDKTGIFSVDGKEFKGKTEVQKFGAAGKQNFSLVCQQNGDNSDFALLQTTFVSEADAKGNSTLKLYSGSMLPMTDPEPGYVTVALSGVGYDLGDKEFTGSAKSGGTVQVNGNLLTLADLKLFNSEGKVKVVSGKIAF